MLVRHLAQWPAYSLCSRNASCGYHFLSKCLGKGGRQKGRREGKTLATKERPSGMQWSCFILPLGEGWEGNALDPLLQEQPFLGCISPSGCFGGSEVRYWVKLQRTLPRAGERTAPGTERNRGSFGEEHPPPLTLAAKACEAWGSVEKHSGGFTLSLAHGFPGSQEGTERAWPPPREDRVPDKIVQLGKSSSEREAWELTMWAGFARRNEVQGIWRPAHLREGTQE